MSGIGLGGVWFHSKPPVLVGSGEHGAAAAAVRKKDGCVTHATTIN